MTAHRAACAAALLALVALWGCGLRGSAASLGRGETPPPGEQDMLSAPTTWSGRVLLTRPVVVPASIRLTLLPGTRVQFDIPAPATEADRKPWIFVTGGFAAAGTAEQPIAFAPSEPLRNGLDDMVKIEGARQAVFRHCSFEQGPWALHAHESSVEVASSVFRDNFGGIRFQGGQVALRGNRFQSNTVGVRCLKASPVLEENAFLGNLTGVFFREGIEGAVVRRNHFDNVEYDIKLGESQADDVDAAENWWGRPGKGTPEDRIYDAGDSPGLGRVKTAPVLAAPFEPTEKRE